MFDLYILDVTFTSNYLNEAITLIHDSVFANYYNKYILLNISSRSYVYIIKEKKTGLHTFFVCIEFPYSKQDYIVKRTHIYVC